MIIGIYQNDKLESVIRIKDKELEKYKSLVKDVFPNEISMKLVSMDTWHKFLKEKEN